VKPLTAADDGTLRDASGRRVVLRGVNMGGRAKRSPYMPFDAPDDATLDQLHVRASALCGRIAGWGCNVIRLPISWHALEPTRGDISSGYLARLGVLLDAAHMHELGVLLDFHQDLYAAPLGGNGFPIWALPPALRAERTPDHRLWFAQYALDPRIAAAYDHFWSDADDLHAAFLNMWRTFLDALGDHPAVLGADLFNEPGWGSQAPGAFIRDTLSPFYAQTIEALRALHPELLYLYGGPGIEMMGLGEHEVRVPGAQVVYAPHLYDPALLLTPAGVMSVPPSRPLAALARWRDESGTPALITELGVTHSAREGVRWLGLVADGLDTHHLGATIWEASGSAALWHGEDLNLIGPDGEDRPAARAWARPWLARVDGEQPTFRWDAASRTASASWVAAGRASTRLQLPRSMGGQWVVTQASGQGVVTERTVAGLKVRAAPGARVALTLVHR
jgi:endoglycosylceramidase